MHGLNTKQSHVSVKYVDGFKTSNGVNGHFYFAELAGNLSQLSASQAINLMQIPPSLRFIYLFINLKEELRMNLIDVASLTVRFQKYQACIRLTSENYTSMAKN